MGFITAKTVQDLEKGLSGYFDDLLNKASATVDSYVKKGKEYVGLPTGNTQTGADADGTATEGKTTTETPAEGITTGKVLTYGGLAAGVILIGYLILKPKKRRRK